MRLRWGGGAALLAVRRTPCRSTPCPAAIPAPPKPLFPPLQLLTLMVVQARSLHMASYALHSPLFKPVAALFDRRWPAPKSVEHGELVLDLPIWVHLPAWLILWLPAQAAAVLELLYQTGVIGEPL